MIYHLLNEQHQFIGSKGFHKVDKGDFIAVPPHEGSTGKEIEIGTNKYVIEQAKAVIHIDELTGALVLGAPAKAK